MMFVNELFISKFVFYVVLFELMVKKLHCTFCDEYWFISVIRR